MTSALLVLLVVACEDGTAITSEPIDLGVTPVTLKFARNSVSEGPTRQVCLDVSPSDADSIAATGVRPPPAPVHVVLINERGKADTLGGTDGAGVIKVDQNTVCLWDQGLGRETYVAIKLWSDRPLQVKEVRWWSGQSKAFF